MTLLEWKTEYSVGIASMDDEHRTMIGLINDIYDAMQQRTDAGAIEQFLGDVHATISMHFALEERIMRDAAYAEYDAHKDDHEELLDELGDLMDTFAADPDAGYDLLGERLSSWFAGHFASFDARLHGKLGV